MKIENVRIQRLRGYDDVSIDFNEYTCFVGANGAGKSTVLCALNIFFRQTENTGTDLLKLDKEDFYRGSTEEPIRITVTFGGLSDRALEVFKDYARGGSLVITAQATFSEDTGRADVKHFGQRLGMAAFKPFFAAFGDGASAADLKVLYEGLREAFSELPKAGTKEANKSQLLEYEASRPGECELIPSEDQFYGVSKGANRLAEFVQWVYVPAIKDAVSEQVEAKDSALGKLLARTVRAKTNFSDVLDALRIETSNRYQELLDANQAALDEISQSLTVRLAEWAHPDTSLRLQWQQERDKSVRIDEPWAHVKVGEGQFAGKLARLGHGLQRSYVIALLQELAAIDGDDGPRLLLAIEEPELYQHPPQARHLSGVLAKLSMENAQVMVSTHSPYFVSGEVFQDVRMVRRPSNEGSATVTWSQLSAISADMESATGKPFGKPSGVIAKLQQTLQPNLTEIFFASRVVLVEGREDVAYLQTYLQLSGLWDDFRKHGCHIVPADKKSEMLRPLIVAKHTNIPAFVVFDADGHEQKDARRAMHRQDNTSLMKALTGKCDNPFPDSIVWNDNHVIWPDCFGERIRADVGDLAWTKSQASADKQFEHAGDLKKNVLHIAARLEDLWNDGARPACLEKLAAQVMAFARA